MRGDTGDVAARVSSFDWAKTALGPMDAWAADLRDAVTLVLSHHQPAWIWWGPDSTTIHNAACEGLVDPDQPDALGVRAQVLVGEPWEGVRSWIAQRDATRGGYAEDRRFLVDHDGGPEERFFTCAASRLGNGVLCTLSETTARVLDLRRIETTYQIARGASVRRDVDDACRAAIDAIARNPHDLPFASIYLVDAATGKARLAGVSGLTAGSSAAPISIELRDATAAWPLARVLEAGRGEILTQLDMLGLRAAPDRPHRAVVLPIVVGGQIAAVLCAGISPLRRLDTGMRGYLDVLVRELGQVIHNSYAQQAELQRVTMMADNERDKTRFFADVTHEFRTPLSLLTAGIEDALMDTRDAMVRDRLRMAHRNAQRLNKLVNNLLDFARIEANRIRASYAPTDLSQLTIDIAASFRAVCESAGIALVVDCPPFDEPAYVDPSMWEKIVLNLLSNAFKYTFVGRIEITLRRRDDVIELAVSDTGVGIDPAHLPRLFERFYRIERAQGRTRDGSGIGLALVRELARWHGGDVHVESRIGVGSLFTVTIKRGTAHLPSDQLDPAHRLISKATRHAYAEEAQQWVPDILADAIPEGPLGVRPRILWADDNSDMRSYVKRILAAEFEVVAVTNGQAALDAIRTKPFDLIIADVMMPVMDGLSLLDALRADPRERRLPVLLLSGRTGDEAAIAALERGADEYLVKPCSPARLLATVRSHLALARLRDDAVPQQPS